MQYISPATGEIIEKEVQISDNIYGKNLRAFVIMLKNLTSSHGKIADLIWELGAPSFSTERVQNISDEFTSILENKRDEFLEEIRRSNYTHSDETGMRKLSVLKNTSGQQTRRNLSLYKVLVDYLP